MPASDFFVDLYPRAEWRVIVHRDAPGPSNMAVDEAIMAAVCAGNAPPTLRFYGWSPPCLSLGYAQPAGDVDFGRLAGLGWDIVRRLTGGRAILHADELTYSVAVPASDPRVAGDIVASYRRLSAGLMAGLDRLGASVRADPAASGARGFKGPVCFEVPSDYEITARGRKLIGSAQTRREGGAVVLQHGALPLSGDVARICEALAFDGEADREAARERVRGRAITLEEALGEPVTFDRAAGAMAAGFAAALNLDLAPGDLTPGERAAAERLRAEKYASPAWTRRH
jgi:lipoate-protein ligase A